MSQDCGTGEVVNGYEIDIGVAQRCAEHIPADAAEPIDANLNCHAIFSPWNCSGFAFGMNETETNDSAWVSSIYELRYQQILDPARPSTKPIRLSSLSTTAK
jgi:hypothetical protein